MTFQVYVKFSPIKLTSSILSLSLSLSLSLCVCVLSRFLVFSPRPDTFPAKLKRTFVITWKKRRKHRRRVSYLRHQQAAAPPSGAMLTGAGRFSGSSAQKQDQDFFFSRPQFFLYTVGSRHIFLLLFNYSCCEYINGFQDVTYHRVCVSVFVCVLAPCCPISVFLLYSV